MDLVSPALSAALDRTGISNRNAAFVLAATVDSLGLPIEDFKLSAETIRRTRRTNRQLRANEIRKSFSVEDALVIHWDSKLLPALTGTASVERLAIYVSGGSVTKLLGIPIVPNGTGEAQAVAVTETLQEWGLTDDVEFMGFDTTSVNTGERKGTCAILQKTLGRSLINLACRHHIFELLVGAAFESQFGPTSSPEVPLFKRFRSHWEKIDRKRYEAGTADANINIAVTGKVGDLIHMMTNKLQQTGENELRGDYRELLELGIVFLGGVPPRGVCIQAPVAFHHARWMAKLVYSFKIFIFRAQFSLNLDEHRALINFLIFVVIIYVGAWFRCKNGVAAPRRDLELLKKLADYREKNLEISKATTEKFLRHLWYLNEVAIGLSFFDPEISEDMKRVMVTALHQSGSQQIPSRVTLKPENISTAELHQFVTENTMLLFDALRVETGFLQQDPSDWENDAGYQAGRLKASQLQVVNDIAERGIALIKTFNPIVTKHEEQMQFLLQIVEQHRKDVPKSTKGALAKHFSTK